MFVEKTNTVTKTTNLQEITWNKITFKKLNI